MPLLLIGRHEFWSQHPIKSGLQPRETRTMGALRLFSDNAVEELMVQRTLEFIGSVVQQPSSDEHPPGAFARGRSTCKSSLEGAQSVQPILLFTKKAHANLGEVEIYGEMDVEFSEFGLARQHCITNGITAFEQQGALRKRTNHMRPVNSVSHDGPSLNEV